MNTEAMMLQFFKDLMVTDNHNMYLYAHNMSRFDGIIALYYLIKNQNEHSYTFKPQAKADGTLLGIPISSKLKNKKAIKITLVDSYQILSSSLEDLSKVYNCPNKKGYYPYSFINKKGIKEGLEYKGVVPSIEYLDKLNVEEYDKFVGHLASRYKEYNGNWVSVEQLDKYIRTDLNNLYLIISNFAEETFNYFSLNISRIRTNAGLAFLLYNSRYYNPEKEQIYLTNGKVDNYVREGYYGGIVDLASRYIDYLASRYKPVYKYDVNSHYPNVMTGRAYHGGKPRLSNETDLDKIFGFVRAKVTAPTVKQLRVPILPIKKNGEIVLFRGSECGT